MDGNDTLKVAYKQAIGRPYIFKAEELWIVQNEIHLSDELPVSPFN